MSESRASRHGRVHLIDGQRVVMTQTEHHLFTELLGAGGEALSHRYIEHFITTAWNVVVPRLRAKLWGTRFRIRSVRGVGYRLVRTGDGSSREGG